MGIHIYDSYRAQNKQTFGKSNDVTEPGTTFPQEPITKTKTRTNTVTREKRIYVHGTIEVKFQGEPEVANSYMGKWEQQFAIFPTEVMVTLTSSSIYTTSPPKEYQAGYSTAELFATPLKQPINCRVQTGDQVEYYQLDLYDIRVKDPILKDITKHDEYSFGTLQGQLFGYALYQYEETVTEQYTEYTGATGHVETKNESGNVFLRQQFYASDGGTYWTDWKRDAKYERSGHTYSRNRQTGFQKGQTGYSDWSWLILLIILVIVIAAWPPFLYAVLAVGGWMLLIFLISRISKNHANT